MLSRRDFIKLCIKGLATYSLAPTMIPELAKAFADSPQKPPVIWLEATTCTGNFLSFLNTLHPNPRQILFDTVDFLYGNTIMSMEGEKAVGFLEEVARERRGEYVLMVEGTIPTKDRGMWSIIGHRRDGSPLTSLEAARYLAQYAKHVMAIGTCASFGGPFAAHPNPTESRPLHKVVQGQVINVPGCPAHPDWTVGTLSHLLLYGVPDLDAYNRPKLFYGMNIHDKCPRRHDFNNSIFADKPGDQGCLYKIGCKGPVTFSDCPTRQWIGEHHNWPVGANSPCIGCVSPEFPDGMSPFFEHLPEIKTPAVVPKLKNLATVAGAVTLGGIGAHLGANIVTGRLGTHWVKGTETSQLNNQAITDTIQEEIADITQQLTEIIAQQEVVKHRIKQLQPPKHRIPVLSRLTAMMKRRNKGRKGE